MSFQIKQKGIPKTVDEQTRKFLNSLDNSDERSLIEIGIEELRNGPASVLRNDPGSGGPTRAHAARLATRPAAEIAIGEHG